jgi:curved DNA-binding protein CbpA
MQNDIKHSFEILEISPDATYEEAKASYRLLAQVWHPDKHAHNDKIHEKATDKLKELNAAWSEVESYFNDETAQAAERQARARQERAQNAGKDRPEQQHKQRQRTASRQTGSSRNSAGFNLVTCPWCSVENRVPKDRLPEAKCGRCGKYIHPRKRSASRWNDFVNDPFLYLVSIAVLVGVIFFVFKKYRYLIVHH